MNCKLLAKGLLMTILVILCGCASTSSLRTDEEVYSFPYPDYRYHDYWYRLYPDDFWYYDYYYPYYWLDSSGDNNCQPLKKKLNQIKERIKDYRQAWREAREKRINRRKQIRKKRREWRREMRERRREIVREWRKKIRRRFR